MPVAAPSPPHPHVAIKYYDLAVRHPTLYDTKGDVVLVARQSSSNVRQLFRVNRSAFGQWEALSKALDGKGNIQYHTDYGVEDGPCVEMNDSAEDVAAFVSAHTSEAIDALYVSSYYAVLSPY